MGFAVVIGALALVAGAIAAIVGAGGGSVLTPTFSLHTTMTVAIVAAAVPHFLSTAVRFWSLRHAVDRDVLKRFGLTSAAAGLVGAFAHKLVGSGALVVVFAVLLVLAGAIGVSGKADRLSFRGRSAYVGGLLTGFFGGIAGEQGGIRAVALLGFDVKKDAFVATSTATALIIDAVRVPVRVPGDLVAGVRECMSRPRAIAFLQRVPFGVAPH